MITTADHRADTKFEIATIKQGANGHAEGWTVNCYPRQDAVAHVADGVVHVAFAGELGIPSEWLTQDEHNVVIAAFALLERFYERAHGNFTAGHPQRIQRELEQHHAKLNAMKAAAADAAQSAEAASAARAATEALHALEKAKHEAEIQALREQHERLTGAIAKAQEPKEDPGVVAARRLAKDAEEQDKRIAALNAAKAAP